MIQSLFILSPVGEVLIERHFRGVVTSRSVCETFWEAASQNINHHGGVSSSNRLFNLAIDSLPPVMEVPEVDQGSLYLITIVRDGLSYLAVCPAEVSPLLIIEFLHRIADIFVEYLGEPADEAAIKENFSLVYQLLEEMVDYGWPLTTEPNALKGLIRPPASVMSKLLMQTAIVSEELPSGTVSSIPWRAANVFYSNNEIYMDIIEEVDAIVDPAGLVVSSDVSGSIVCQSQLSGVPDLLLTFKEPQLIDDCSFHPCVRYSRFEKDQVVSFVPPDGTFTLMRYRISPDKARSFVPPIYCHSQWSLSSTEGQPSKGRLSLQVGLASLSTLVLSPSRKGPFQIENVAVTIPLKATKSTVNFTVSVGSVLYDEASKVARWTLGSLEASSTTTRATLTCSFEAASQPKKGGAYSESAMDSPPNLSLHWKIPLASVSGLTVSGLSVTGETYRPYKGVRNITQSGNFQVRCSN
jgi:AP-3 complex subunit mu